MIIETEEELLRSVKQWIKKRGKSVLIASLIFVSIGTGWYAAKQQNDNKLAQASVLYEELLGSISNQDIVNTQALAKRLVETYKHTPYAKLGALLLTKTLVESGKLDLAKEQLRWVMEKAEIPAVREIARLRLARISLAENQKEAALTALNSIDDSAFAPLVDQIKGDIQKASGLKNAAKTSYQNAISNWPANFPGKEFIKLKLQQLLSN